MSDRRRDSDFDAARPTPATAGGPRRLRDEPLLRLLMINGLIGAAVAVLLSVAVIATDTAHLRSLIFSSREPWIGILLLVFGFLVTLCSVAMATAVMMLPKDDDDDDHRGGGTRLEVLRMPSFAPPPAPVPVRVPVRSDRVRPPPARGR